MPSVGSATKTRSSTSPIDGDNKRPRRHRMQPRATFTVLIRYRATFTTVLIRYEDLHSTRGTANGDRRAYRRRSRPMLGQVDSRQTVEAADDVACTSKPIQGRVVNADRIYGLCPLRPGLSLPVNLGRQGRTGSGAPLSLQRRIVCEPDFRAANPIDDRRGFHGRRWHFPGLEACTKISLPPRSEAMKPNPFMALYHLTVPDSSTAARSACGYIGRG
jgi:hypothetical protein